MTSTRCFVCAARAFEPTDRVLLYPSRLRRAFPFACTSCGLLVLREEDFEACGADLSRRLSTRSFLSDETMDYGMDAYTLRIAATKMRRGIKPLGEAQRSALRHPHASLAAAADLFELDTAPQAAVALGIACRPAEMDGVLASLAAHADWAREVVLLLDDAPAGASPVAVEGFSHGSVRVARRRLAGDFAAQRNALTSLSSSPWMLQLDADETLEPETGALLGALAFQADADGLVSIGLGRRNVVDGVLSDLFPDTQYRLNRRSVRYAGRVHERPVRDWRHGTLSLHGAILHRLDGAHVETRSRRYEAMDPGRGRLDEAGRLLEPYRA